MELETAIAFTDELVFAKVGIHLSDLQQAMLRASWSWERQSYDQIAEQYGYSPTYLKHDVGPKLWKLLSEVLGEKVNKTSFRSAIERQYQRQEVASATQIPPEELESSAISSGSAIAAESTRGAALTAEVPWIDPVLPRSVQQDWGEAVDVTHFYGRQSEITQLIEWIVTDRCRLVALLGIGGIGKSALAAKLAQQIVQIEAEKSASDSTPFQFVICRSLRNAPTVQELLTDLLQVFLNRQAISENIPESVAGKIGRLLQCLRSYRCLLVLDNVEMVLGGIGHNEYRELLRQIGETLHQSCLLITSREKPREVAMLEGATLPVRSFQLTGLSIAAGQALLQLKGNFQGSDHDWQQLVEGYSGNPLALKMISTPIQSLFAGNLRDFLQQETFVFGNIRSLIDQQFEQLSATEQAVLYELAINREPTAFATLRSDLFPPPAAQTLIEVMESLEHRSLVERHASLFSLQPLVMEYVIDRFNSQVVQEIQNQLESTSSKKLLSKSHAILKATAKDYIRETQSRLIVQPIRDRLLEHQPLTMLEEQLWQLLANLQNRSIGEIGYAASNLLNLLLVEQSALEGRDLSNLPLWQVDFRSIALKRVNLSNVDLNRSIFSETLGIVFTVSFSPNGELLATGDAEGGLRLWQVADGKLLLSLTGHSGWVWSIAFSQDGTKLASGSSDKTIRIWDVATGTCLQVLQAETGSIWSVAFSPDGQQLASGGDEAAVKIWDIASASCTELSGHTGRVLAVAFAAHQNILATGGEDGSVRLWNLSTKKCETCLQAHTQRVWSVAFSPDDKILASGSADRTIKLWQIDSGICLKTLDEHGDRVRSVTFSPDGQQLVSSSDDQTVRLWNVAQGDCRSILRGHRNTIFSVTFNADGQTIASGSADQTVRFWQAASGRCLKTLQGYTNSIFSIAFSPDGQQLASSSTDQTIRLWNLSRQECRIFTGHGGWVTSVAFHPQGKILASSSADQTVRLWNVQTGTLLKVLQGHAHWVQSVAFSPNGSWLASGGDDRTVRIWSVQTGECLQTLAGHQSWVWSIAFSPDSKILASSSDDQTICLWEMPTGKCLKVLKGHRGQIQSIAFSPNGALLASGSGDETVRIWDVARGDCLQVLLGHQNNVWSVAFSPDGHFVASGSLDQTVRLWDVQQGVNVRTLSVRNQSVRSSITFSPLLAKQGYTLATGSHSQIQVWDTSTGEIRQQLIPDRPYEGTQITGVTGLTEAQKQALKALGAIEL